MCEDHWHLQFEELKTQADSNWLKNPQRSRELAQQIIDQAQQNNCPEYVAMGTMALADALKFLGDMALAWDEFDRSGNLYLEIGHKFGWARTRIGRLAICVEVGKAEQALADIPEVRAIFSAAGDHDRNRRLYQNAAIAYQDLGRLEEAESALNAAIEFARLASGDGKNPLAELHSNLGVVHGERGNWTEAQRQFLVAMDIFKEQESPSGVATALNNLAWIGLKIGHYRDAFDNQYRSLSLMDDTSPQFKLQFQRTLMECHVALSRYREAIRLGEQVADGFATSNAGFQHARALWHLSFAYAGLATQYSVHSPEKAADLFRLAHRKLEEAKAFFKHETLTIQIASVELRHGQIAFLERNYEAAYASAELAIDLFGTSGTHEMQSAASLLMAQALCHLARGLPRATQLAEAVNKVARRIGSLSLRQQAHYILGAIYEADQQPSRALRHYALSAAQVDRLQQSMSFSMVSGSLLHQDAALRAMVRLSFSTDDPSLAFARVEQLKASTIMRFLMTPENQRWNIDDPKIRSLVDSFNTLRAEYFERNMHVNFSWQHQAEQNNADPRTKHDDLSLEQRIQSIKDQLYSHSTLPIQRPATDINLEKIQARLAPHDKLIEYFVDGSMLWALVISATSIVVRALGAIVSSTLTSMTVFRDVLDHLNGLRSNYPLVRSLIWPTMTVLKELHKALIAPLVDLLASASRLFIVPFGTLHNVPFNLLYDGTKYLIQDYEIVTLPTASLLLREAVIAPHGAHGFSHSANNKLKFAKQEAEAVVALFGGRCWPNEDTQAVVDELHAKPKQILHLAMHAMHLFDQPEFSFIAFADRRVMTDDILQYDLSYELVTMSACETGLVRTSGGDEPIGLGRGFLYAGAGAIVSTLWSIYDETTLQVMKRFYALLHAGYSKSQALQCAQIDMLTSTEHPLHPAYWGAFQLIGDPKPLSSHI